MVTLRGTFHKMDVRPTHLAVYMDGKWRRLYYDVESFDLLVIGDDWKSDMVPRAYISNCLEPNGLFKTAKEVGL